ncbi:HNH endonuclease [Bacillus velezensis]
MFAYRAHSTKEKFPDLTYSWENLTLACPKCNLNKEEYYEDELP